jgi:hypothetical protein
MNILNRQDAKTPRIVQGLPNSVMPGLVPGIHVFVLDEGKTWMAGTSPAMTIRGKRLGALAPWWFNHNPSALSECSRRS